MKMIFALCATLGFLGCKNKKENNPDEPVLALPYFRASVAVNNCGLTNNRSVTVNYSFFQQDNGISPSEASSILWKSLKDENTCRVLKAVEQSRPGSIDAVRIEQYTNRFDRIISPINGAYKTKAVSLAEKALAFALDYFHNYCDLTFTKKNLKIWKYGENNQTTDSLIDFKIILTGKQNSRLIGIMYWYAGSELIGTGTDTVNLTSFGESGQSLMITRNTDTTWSVASLVDRDITIDAVTPNDVEVFESIFFEILHKIIWRHRYNSMMHKLNSPPYYPNVDIIMAEYGRLDEIAVHYTVICLMREMIKQGLFPGKIPTDPFVKYKDDEAYKGLLPLLQKYPPSLSNGRMVMKIFMENPKNIDKL